MPKRSYLLAMLLVLLVGETILAEDSPRVSSGDSEAQRQILFDGTSLDGWESVGSAKWRIEEGAIRGGQDGDPKRSGLLFTKAVFQDFDLGFQQIFDSVIDFALVPISNHALTNKREPI